MKKYLKKIGTSLLTFAFVTTMFFGTSTVLPALADEPNDAPVTQDANAQGVYVLMNIPYDEFYKAEMSSDVEVDIVTSASERAYNAINNAGSYHDTNTEAKDILGVTYPVQVESLQALPESWQQVVPEEGVDAEEALFGAGDYAYVLLDEAPSGYKTLSVENGVASFGEAICENNDTATTEYNMMMVTMRGDYELTFTSEALSNTIYGVVLHTEDGADYAMRHLENIWEVADHPLELALFTGHTETIKDGALTPNDEDYLDLEGKTITSMTILTKNDAGEYQKLTVNTNIEVPAYLNATFVDEQTIQIHGLLESDVARVSVHKDSGENRYFFAEVGNDEEVLAESADVSAEGIITLDTPATYGQTYNITISRMDIRRDTVLQFVSIDATYEDVTYIYTAEDLAKVAEDLSGNYKLMADIDLSSYDNWTPLGTFVPKGEGEEAEFANPDYAFSGVFDGNGHTISNLNVNQPYAAGLFGCVAARDGEEESGIVKNFTIDNAHISATMMGAAAVGYASVDSTIENVTVQNSNITGVNSDDLGPAGMIGGVAGAAMDAEVKDCTASNVNVTAEGIRNSEGLGANVSNIGILGGGFEGTNVNGNTAEDSTLTITGDTNNAYGFGGLVGCAMAAEELKDNTVDNVTIRTGEGVQLVGGLAGYTGQPDGEDPTDASNNTVNNSRITVGQNSNRIGGLIGGGFYFDEYAAYYPTDTVSNIDGNTKVENTTITAGRNSTDVDKIMGRQADSTISEDVSVEGTRVTIQSSSGGGGGGSVIVNPNNPDPEDPDNNDPTDNDNPFVDVNDSDYYKDAVDWAVKEGITAGTTATTFSPDIICTRAQAVTLMWRANGSPIVEGDNTFTDVAADAYYAEAVRWAVAEGITVGTSATTFSPEDTCTRAQIVTMLHRAADTPDAAATLFSDVAADAYYAEAVQWAVAEDITSGTSATTFSPDNGCTRAQIVTFLYRQMN